MTTARLKSRLRKLEIARPGVKRADGWDRLTAEQCEHYALTGELPAGVTEEELTSDPAWDALTPEQCEHYALTGKLPAGVTEEALLAPFKPTG